MSVWFRVRMCMSVWFRVRMCMSVWFRVRMCLSVWFRVKMCLSVFASVCVDILFSDPQAVWQLHSSNTRCLTVPHLTTGLLCVSLRAMLPKLICLTKPFRWVFACVWERERICVQQKPFSAPFLSEVHIIQWLRIRLPLLQMSWNTLEITFTLPLL